MPVSHRAQEPASSRCIREAARWWGQESTFGLPAWFARRWWVPVGVPQEQRRAAMPRESCSFTAGSHTSALHATSLNSWNRQVPFPRGLALTSFPVFLFLPVLPLGALHEMAFACDHWYDLKSKAIVPLTLTKTLQFRNPWASYQTSSFYFYFSSHCVYQVQNYRLIDSLGWVNEAKWAPVTALLKTWVLQQQYW